MPRWSSKRLHAQADASAGTTKSARAGDLAYATDSGEASAGLLTLDQINPDSDPYLHWAVLTRWRGFARLGQWSVASDGKLAAQTVRIIMQADDASRINDVHDSFAASREPPSVAGVPAVYRQVIPGTERFSLHATATLRICDLGILLKKFPDLRWELSAPLKDQDPDEPGSARGYFGQQTKLDGAFRKSVLPSTLVQPKGSRGPAAEGTVAVIDFGCPFLHQRWGNGDDKDESSRLHALWDQGDALMRRPWKKPKEMGYGRMLTDKVLAGAWCAVRTPTFAHDEARVYASLNYLIEYNDPRRRVFLATHGAHVLDVAGGVTHPLRPSTNPGDEKGAGVDPASRARLVFVQLPEETAGDSSGGSLGAHLLDAMRYVMQVSPANQPLVVNVSFGSTAGPHDGSSLIEQALDELLDSRRTGLALVLSAGNSRRAGLHVQRRASAAHRALFRIAVVGGDSTDTFVEFWYVPPTRGTLQFRARLPGGEWSEWVEPNAGVALRDSATGDVVAAVVHQRQLPNRKPGALRSMALLALRPTEAPDGDEASLAEAGLWEVEACLEGADARTAVDIDGWVERDDPRAFSGRKQTQFIGLEPGDAENTLSSIANGDLTLVVGGFRGSSGEEVEYSSTGPRRSGQWPLTYALCEIDGVDPGLRAAAVRSGETLLMNGTSVAAPMMARHVFNLMLGFHKTQERLPTREELWGLLEEESRRPSSLIRTS